VNAADIDFPHGNVDYSKVHDEVVAIDPTNMTVTINLINGFSFGKPVWYISMDSRRICRARQSPSTEALNSACLQIALVIYISRAPAVDYLPYAWAI
jgi:hypothetical protein